MTSQLLASELANLIQESKRKHNDLRQVRNIAPLLRTVPELQNGAATPPPLPPTADLTDKQAADKSLDELRSLKTSSEAQTAEGVFIAPHSTSRAELTQC
jgi:hypothetical protein